MFIFAVCFLVYISNLSWKRFFLVRSNRYLYIQTKAHFSTKCSQFYLGWGAGKGLLNLQPLVPCSKHIRISLTLDGGEAEIKTRLLHTSI
jgi:hypothetical protein